MRSSEKQKIITYLRHLANDFHDLLRIADKRKKTLNTQAAIYHIKQLAAKAEGMYEVVSSDLEDEAASITMDLMLLETIYNPLFEFWSKVLDK